MLPEVERYRQWLRRKYPRTTTLRHYSNDLQLFFTWAKKSPRDVTLRDVDAYIEHCQQLGHRSATINRRLAAVRGLYRFLDMDAEEGDAWRNPVLPQRHFIRRGERLPRDVEDRDLQRLFDVIADGRDRAIFLLMLRCGLRVGEIEQLSLGDLYLAPSGVNLPRLWLHGKGGRERVVYLSAQPLAALQAWLGARPTLDQEAVFVNCFGGRLSVSGVQKRLAAYCHLAGVDFSCHQFRHTFGRHLAEAHVPATTIQRLLGHASLRTSETYIHISDGQAQADYDAAMKTVARRLRLPGGAK